MLSATSLVWALIKKKNIERVAISWLWLQSSGHWRSQTTSSSQELLSYLFTKEIKEVTCLHKRLKILPFYSCVSEVCNMNSGVNTTRWTQVRSCWNQRTSESFFTLSDNSQCMFLRHNTWYFLLLVYNDSVCVSLSFLLISSVFTHRWSLVHRLFLTSLVKHWSLEAFLSPVPIRSSVFTFRFVCLTTAIVVLKEVVFLEYHRSRWEDVDFLQNERKCMRASVYSSSWHASKAASMTVCETYVLLMCYRAW